MTVEQPDLHSALIRAGAGDQAAFAEVFDHLVDDIWWLARAASASAADCERVAAAMFASLWSHAPRYDGSLPPRVWASSLAWTPRRTRISQSSDSR